MSADGPGSPGPLIYVESVMDWFEFLARVPMSDKFRLIAYSYGMHANKASCQAYPGRDLLAWEAHCSEKTVSRARAWFAEVGLLEVLQTRGNGTSAKTTVCRLTIPEKAYELIAGLRPPRGMDATSGHLNVPSPTADLGTPECLEPVENLGTSGCPEPDLPKVTSGHSGVRTSGHPDVPRTVLTKNHPTHLENVSYDRAHKEQDQNRDRTLQVDTTDWREPAAHPAPLHIVGPLRATLRTRDTRTGIQSPLMAALPDPEPSEHIEHDTNPIRSPAMPRPRHARWENTA